MSDERWRYVECWEGAGFGDVLTGGGYVTASTVRAETGRRLAAAMNACAGIPTSALESGALAKALEMVESGFIVPECDGSEEGCPSCGARRLLRSLGRTP